MSKNVELEEDRWLISSEIWTQFLKSGRSGRGYLVFLDEAKPFDKVNHDDLFMALEIMGINGRFLRFLIQCYTNITSQVLINGQLTEKINIEQAIQQGCAFFRVLFMLVCGPVMFILSSCLKNKGYITKKKRKVKIQSYADDNAVLIKDPWEYGHIYWMYVTNTCKGQCSED